MKSVGLKKRPKKILCISVKSVGQNFHRISRMNRRQTCLSDYSRIFTDIWPLANGSRPIYAAIVFVTQISQITQIFLRGRVWSHRFHRYTQILYGISGESLCPIPGGIFSSWDYFCPTDFTDIHRFFMESLVNHFVRSQGVSVTTEQVASAKFRVIR